MRDVLGFTRVNQATNPLQIITRITSVDSARYADTLRQEHRLNIHGRQQ